jgi:hypothetical protein
VLVLVLAIVLLVLLELLLVAVLVVVVLLLPIWSAWRALPWGLPWLWPPLLSQLRGWARGRQSVWLLLRVATSARWAAWKVVVAPPRRLAKSSQQTRTPRCEARVSSPARTSSRCSKGVWS